MKHLSLITLILFFFGNISKAAPGDTTVVQSGHTATQLVNFGNYDAPAVFPTSATPTYRNINMTFTLGKYACPGNPQYCGDWDYTVQVFLHTATDSFEIGRLITPYAGISRFPFTWQHRYNFDLTDYAQYLKGNTIIRVHYSGFSGGFTSNIKFTFIEGTPPRNVVKISRLWHGSFGYGNSTSIENKVNNRTLLMPANATGAELKFLVTGHGANAGDNCSEFCSKYYQVKVNNSLISQTNIWRANCGSNNLYPQTGTWIYDRANWCPGDVVYSNFHPIHGITAGANFNLDVDFQAYSNPGSQASYTVEGQVIYYGPYNYTTDAALEAIISPNDYEGYFRSNPVCEEAKVKVKNTGNTNITSLEFTYGLGNSTTHTYSWTTLIEPGQTEEIILPGNTEFVTMPNGLAAFTARISKVNGTPDANLLNNELKTKFTPMPVWPNEFIIRLTTNNGGYNANKWKIFDASGNLVRERINTTNSTTYLDTLAMPVGCYRLEVTDNACNGLQWWAAPSQGNGSMMVRYKSSPQQLPMKGYFSGDFGCGFNQAFRVQTALGVKKDFQNLDVAVFPVPAEDMLTVQLKNNNSGKATSLELYNTLGQRVFYKKTMQQETRIPVEHLPAGVYVLKCQAGDNFSRKQVIVTH